MNHKVKGLRLREWIACICLFSLVFSVCSFEIFTSKFLKTSFISQKDKYDHALIEINVSGAVISPGVYKFPPGITVKEVLGSAGIRSTADKKSINFHKKIYSATELSVPEK